MQLVRRGVGRRTYLVPMDVTKKDINVIRNGCLYQDVTGPGQSFFC